MRWDALFSDLEAQAEVLTQAERASEVDERTRYEVGASGILDRLRAAVGEPIQLSCIGGLALRGTLCALGADWLLIDEGVGAESLVVLDAVCRVRGVGRRSVPAGPASLRLALRSALRGIARDRLPVRAVLRDGSTITATIDRVGSDYVEMAAHAVGELRRRNDVITTELVPFTGLAAIRRRA